MSTPRTRRTRRTRSVASRRLPSDLESRGRSAKSRLRGRWQHLRLAWEVGRHPPDVLFVPAHVLPLCAPRRCVVTVHDLGYQCSFHCIGDAAMDMALDAIEYAMNRNPRPDPRHRIEHAVISTQSALERTRDLGVTISTQPHGIYYFGEAVREMMGEERAQSMMPTRTWLELGVPLSISSRICCGGTRGVS